MTTRKISNLLALAVLSLLTERRMHPYEVSAVMRQRELSSVIKLNYGALYSLIEALQREGLIAPVETQRAGRYPERTIYAKSLDYCMWDCGSRPLDLLLPGRLGRADKSLHICFQQRSRNGQPPRCGKVIQNSTKLCPIL